MSSQAGECSRICSRTMTASRWRVVGLSLAKSARNVFLAICDDERKLDGKISQTLYHLAKGKVSIISASHALHGCSLARRLPKVSILESI